MLTDGTASETERYTPQATLPGRDYYDPGVLDVERERIFFRSWVCVARVEELGSPGDIIVRDVAGELVLLSHDTDGRLHAFFDVCRHRGTRLVEADAHVRKAITCPYHAWTYGLDGALLGTPNVGRDEGLDRDRLGLRAIALDTWDGFVFVNMAPDPPPLHEALADDPEEPLQFARFGIGDLRIGYRDVTVVEANWKIVADNYNECLHCPTVHPELVTMIPVYRRGTTVEDPESWGVSLAPGATSLTRTGTSCLPPLPGITDEDRHSYSGCFIFPTLSLDITSDVVIASITYPTGPERTVSTNLYLFRPETIADPGFDPSEVVEFSNLVGDQDTRVCEIAQSGVRSRGFANGGVLPSLDRYLADFKERYLALRGPM
jgi:phenylpropionate dioxygenase-like ring-hydroxylating dioxygenase large terminal subunit